MSEKVHLSDLGSKTIRASGFGANNVLTGFSQSTQKPLRLD